MTAPPPQRPKRPSLVQRQSSILHLSDSQFSESDALPPGYASSRGTPRGENPPAVSTAEAAGIFSSGENITGQLSESNPSLVGHDTAVGASNQPPSPPLPQDPPVLLSKFTLYETKQRFYIVGSNFRETRFRVLSIDLGTSELNFSETEGVLTRAQMLGVLDRLKAEAQQAGDALNKRQTAWGILGFIRFTEHYYICLVTKCSPVALLGGHYIFHIDETKLLPVVHSSIYRQPDRRSPEDRLLGIFHTLELSKTFYFSPSYDLTHTLQANLIREKQQLPNSRQEIFVWNVHLLRPVLERFGAAMDWCLSAVHGFIDQAKISLFGTSIFITLIARRSHYFAGARYLKRGINNQGHVANEVETEQIVSNHLISSFHDPRTGPYSSPRYTSYVQHRGSISLKWSQFTSNMSPKPPIHLDGNDPYYAPAAIHFDNLMGRYGASVRVLNLVKQTERRPRESVLGQEFARCITYLNKFLPYDNKIHYTAWDMSRASRGPASDVIEYLEQYAEETLQATQFFHNGETLASSKLQQGICRTNCIDCLDRTNAAQSVIAKRALGYQLHAIGIIDKPEIDYDTDVVDLLTEMWHDHGDTIALQYGGSNLVNTVETYRKINQWSSHSRDLIESIRRFYNNSFIDAQRQDAINLFLGNYQFNKQKGVNLWELSTDYYLHNAPRAGDVASQRSYRFWYTPWNLLSMRERLESGTFFHELDDGKLGPIPTLELQFEHYWNRIYVPRVLSSLSNLFVMRMNSTAHYKKADSVPTSPFAVHHKMLPKPDKATAGDTSDSSDEASGRSESESTSVALEEYYEKYAALISSVNELGDDSDLWEQYAPIEDLSVDQDSYEGHMELACEDAVTERSIYEQYLTLSA